MTETIVSEPGSAPWNMHVAIKNYDPAAKGPIRNGWTGSGVVVGPRHVLTAGHNVPDYEYVSGDLDGWCFFGLKGRQYKKKIRFRKVHVHQGFYAEGPRQKVAATDIAMVYLEEEVPAGTATAEIEVTSHQDPNTSLEPQQVRLTADERSQLLEKLSREELGRIVRILGMDRFTNWLWTPKPGHSLQPGPRRPSTGDAMLDGMWQRSDELMDRAMADALKKKMREQPLADRPLKDHERRLLSDMLGKPLLALNPGTSYGIHITGYPSAGKDQMYDALHQTYTVRDGVIFYHGKVGGGFSGSAVWIPGGAQRRKVVGIHSKGLTVEGMLATGDDKLYGHFSCAAQITPAIKKLIDGWLKER